MFMRFSINLAIRRDLIVIQVMLACFKEILSHASGGNCSARQTKYLHNVNNGLFSMAKKYEF